MFHNAHETTFTRLIKVQNLENLCIKQVDIRKFMSTPTHRLRYEVSTLLTVIELNVLLESKGRNAKRYFRKVYNYRARQDLKIQQRAQC